MIEGIQLKVCGITSVKDAETASRCGADHLGFNFYPPSPRGISLPQFRAMAPDLPAGSRVAVAVEPTRDALAALRDAGFDSFQIHFGPATPDGHLAAWSRLVGGDRLWLAPKLPPEADVSPAALAAAGHIMLDTYHAKGFGGSGLTGDWEKFARHQAAHPAHTWILAGGLNAGNIGEALRRSGARFVDVNSGVESAPGIKDGGRLQAFVAAIRAATRPHGGAAGA